MQVSNCSAISATLAATLLVGCLGTTEDRVLSVDATGVVQGIAYLDANGNRDLDESDSQLEGVAVLLLVRGTRDTLARAASNADGLFIMSRVPVGSYDVAVAPATGADSIEVVEVEPEVVTVASNDSVTVLVAFDKADAQATRGTSRALAVDELPSAQRFPTALVAKVDWADARQRPTTLSAAWLPYSGAGHPAEPPPAAHGSPGA